MERCILLFFILFFCQNVLAKTYNYKVYGNDDAGHAVNGVVLSENNHISGTLYRNKDRISVKGKWIDRGQILAEDEAGNEYDLEVNK